MRTAVCIGAVVAATAGWTLAPVGTGAAEPPAAHGGSVEGGSVQEVPANVESLPVGGLKVVELFTSEGCSSCPPADAVAAELARRPGVLPLGFHVDYWDRLGWTDRFSSPRWTDRQRRYAALLGGGRVYTPQLVLGGVTETVGSNRGDVERLLKETPPAGRLDVSVAAAADGGRLVVVTDAGAAWVNAAAVQPRASSEVPRGENAGRTLTHANVVRDFASVRADDDGGAELTVDVPSGADGAFIVVYSQAEDGRVVKAVRLGDSSAGG